MRENGRDSRAVEACTCYHAQLRFNLTVLRSRAAIANGRPPDPYPE